MKMKVAMPRSLFISFIFKNQVVDNFLDQTKIELEKEIHIRKQSQSTSWNHINFDCSSKPDLLYSPIQHSCRVMLSTILFD